MYITVPPSGDDVGEDALAREADPRRGRAV